MCRIMGFAGGNVEEERIRKYLKAFVKASRHDFLLAKIGKRKSHGDGWGYFIVSVYNNSISYAYGKSVRPVYEEEKMLLKTMDFLVSSEYVFAIYHSRLASPHEPIDIYSTQPFVKTYFTLDSKKGILAFIHNGSVDKEGIASSLGLKEIVDVFSDSYFAAEALALSLSKGLHVFEALNKVFSYTKTAFSTLTINVFEHEISLISTNYFVKTDPLRNKYYSIYVKRLDNITVYASSTIAHIVNEKFTPMKYGSVEKVTFDIRKKQFINEVCFLRHE